MAAENYAGAIMAKGALAVLGKISATTFALTLGIAAMAVVAGAVLVAQSSDLEFLDSEVPNEAKRRKGQM